jgi:hypothetical protein
MFQINSQNIHRLNIEQCLIESTAANNELVRDWEDINTFGSFDECQEIASRNLVKFQRAEEGSVKLTPSRSRTRSDGAYSPVTDNSWNSSYQGSYDTIMFPSLPTVASYNNVSEASVYQVQFKHNFRHYTTQPDDNLAPISIGTFVVVKTDFGEDIGVVTEMYTMSSFLANRKPTADAEENAVGVILRIATQAQREALPAKMAKENKALKTVLRLTHEVYCLPMTIIGAEYQSDMRKLTIHYVSEGHIDFRALVKDLFSAYRVRIWMKKSNNCSVFIPKKFAVASLTTGISFEDNWEGNM